MIVVNVLCLVLCIVLALLLLFALVLVIAAAMVDPQREYDDHSPAYRWLLERATGIGFWILRVRIRTTGVEKIPRGTNKILFVSNHRSNYDPLVTWYALRQWKPAFISKASNFNIPVFGRLVRRCCFMAIDREDPRKALRTIQKAAALLEKEELSVGVYPEGTRSKQCKLLPFHNGVFKIAQKANAPIVVLAISGTEKIHKNIPFRRTVVHLDVLDVIDGQWAAESTTAQIGERTRRLLAAHLPEEQATPVSG